MMYLNGVLLDSDRRWNLFQENYLYGAPGRRPVSLVDVNQNFIGLVGFEEEQRTPLEESGGDVDSARTGSETATLTDCYPDLY